jgi:hypothetical protein
MTRIRVPKNAGRQFEVITTLAGTYAVWNHKSGKNKLLIPCCNQEQALELKEILNSKERPEEIWI